jgi:hypothetical protein
MELGWLYWFCEAADWDLDFYVNIFRIISPTLGKQCTLSPKIKRWRARDRVFVFIRFNPSPRGVLPDSDCGEPSELSDLLPDLQKSRVAEPILEARNKQVQYHGTPDGIYTYHNTRITFAIRPVVVNDASNQFPKCCV